MKTELSKTFNFAVGIFLTFTLGTLAEAPPVRGQYRVIDLGRLSGFRSEARGINAHGDIAGLSTSDIGYQAVRWRLEGTNYVIDALGKGEAYGISEAGTAAGLSETGGGAIWPPGGSPILLGLEKRVNAIGGGGRAAGWISVSVTNPAVPTDVRFPRHAAYFSGVKATDLARRPEWNCEVFGLDRAGSRMVGRNITNVFATTQVIHAWRFPDEDLHTLSSFANSVALAVNSAGQVVGYANNNNSGPFHQPMYWSASTGMRLLNAPSSTPYGSALGMNDLGRAVGALGSSAVLWVNIGQTNETNVFLNNLPPSGHGWNLQAAYGINNRGEIVGYGMSPTGGVNAFCLVPTNIVPRKIDGTIVVFGNEHEPQSANWLKSTNWLERAAVTLLKATPEGLWVPSDHSSVAYGSGDFSFTVRESPEARFRLRVTLSDVYGDTKVCYEPYSSDLAGWMETPEFTVPSDMRADIEMHINETRSVALPNAATYYFNGQQFDLGALETPPGLPPGDSSVGSGYFAHVAVVYRNIRLGERFARDELLMSVLPVKVVTFSLNHNTSWSRTPERPTIYISSQDSLYNYTFVETNGVKRLTGGNRPTNREFHEYGHHIMWMSPLGPGPFSMGGTNHAGLNNASSADSWVEGFATFIGAAIADRMLKGGERSKAGYYLVSGQWKDFNRIYSLDNPVQAGRQFVSSSPALWRQEDLVVASLLWDFYGGKSTPLPPLDEYITTITGFGIPYIYTTNVSRVYEILNGYATFHPTNLNASNVTARFVKAGYYDDQTFAGADARGTNGLFDAGETVGVTSWNTNFAHRPNLSMPLSAYIQVSAFDDAGTPMSGLRVDMRTISPPPLDQAEITNALVLIGNGPWAFPVAPPPPPSSLVIRLSKSGFRPSAELTVDANWFETRQSEAAPDEILMEHSFNLARASVRATRRADGSLEILWPSDVGEVVLESAATLPAAEWTSVALPITTFDGERSVTLAPTGDAQFFRLRAP